MRIIILHTGSHWNIRAFSPPGARTPRVVSFLFPINLSWTQRACILLDNFNITQDYRLSIKVRDMLFFFLNGWLRFLMQSLAPPLWKPGNFINLTVGLRLNVHLTTILIYSMFDLSWINFIPWIPSQITFTFDFSPILMARDHILWNQIILHASIITYECTVFASLLPIFQSFKVSHAALFLL